VPFPAHKPQVSTQNAAHIPQPQSDAGLKLIRLQGAGWQKWYHPLPKPLTRPDLLRHGREARQAAKQYHTQSARTNALPQIGTQSKVSHPGGQLNTSLRSRQKLPSPAVQELDFS
jgi:hypothetical protein